MDDLETRAKEFKVFDLSDFYASAAFKADGFEVQAERRMVVRRFG